MAARVQALGMLSRVPAGQIVRRFVHSSSSGGGGGGAACGAFQVISRRGNHFWSTSAEESGVDVEAEASSSSSSSSGGGGGGGSCSGRRLDVVDEEKITRAAPDWLPLVPGSSYWVPSEEEKKKPGLVKLVNLSDRKIVACISPCGWPALPLIDDEDFSDLSDEDDDDDGDD